MAKRRTPICKKCGHEHWPVVSCEKTAEKRLAAEAAAADLIEQELDAEDAARVPVTSAPATIILRHERAFHGDRVHSRVRMGSRNLALPRERGALVGSKREVA